MVRLPPTLIGFCDHCVLVRLGDLAGSDQLRGTLGGDTLINRGLRLGGDALMF